MSALAADSHWWWAIAGLILLSAEMLLPGVYLVWIGIAALITAVLALALPVPLQLAAFAGLSLTATGIGRRWYRQNPVPTSDPLLNDRAERLVGQVVTVIEAVDRTCGRVKVGDGVWNARGGPATPGTSVRVMGVDGTCLLVEPA